MKMQRLGVQARSTRPSLAHAPRGRQSRIHAAAQSEARSESEKAPEVPASKAKTENSDAAADRKPSPLARGGTLTGNKAAGKDAGASAKAMATGAESSGSYTLQIVDGYFRDDRWVNGTWDMKAFAKANGETDWDAVIDAEMARRKLLEDSPIPSRNDDPVNFDTRQVPWWPWVRRFHLPVAEKLNGRAAMMGYLLAGIVDLGSGAGLVEQQESFFGKLLLHLTVFAVLLIQETGDIERYKNLLDEATFYDKQWNATWEGQVRPSEKESS